MTPTAIAVQDNETIAFCKCLWWTELTKKAKYKPQLFQLNMCATVDALKQGAYRLHFQVCFILMVTAITTVHKNEAFVLWDEVELEEHSLRSGDISHCQLLAIH